MGTSLGQFGMETSPGQGGMGISLGQLGVGTSPGQGGMGISPGQGTFTAGWTSLEQISFVTCWDG